MAQTPCCLAPAPLASRTAPSLGGQARDRRKTLLLRLIPFVERLEPHFVFIENVPGLRSSQAPAGTFSRFCKALATMGYNVSHAVLDCQRYGVPQRRRRLVILASRLGPISVPEPTHGVGRGLMPISTVWEWIRDLPAVGPGEQHPDVPNHVVSAVTEINLRRLRATPPGGGRADWPAELRLACHKQHTGHSDVYGRMQADAPSQCSPRSAPASPTGGSATPSGPDRPISVREAACLQTFPRGFVFEGGIKSATRQVGNAVPVLFAERMGEAFVSHLSEPPRPPERRRTASSSRA